MTKHRPIPQSYIIHPHLPSPDSHKPDISSPKPHPSNVPFQDMAISAPETHHLHLPQQPSTATKLEVESVKCYCCNFSEDCTPAYISRVRDRFQGRWLCGLCVEAVKDEVIRSESYISTEEALNRHVSFCKKFSSSSRLSQKTEHPIFVMSKILRRSLDSPRAVRSNSSSVLPDVDKIRGSSLVRSESCFSALSR